jgi:hypothetical protein
MTVGNSGPAITAGDDPRITRVGRFLRDTKIDELPQLWNLVRGDISLVGPRPESPEYVDFGNQLWQRVLGVRPGITGPVTLSLRDQQTLLAGVPRDRDAYYRKVLLPYKLRGNIEYLQRRTWKSDVQLVLQTCRAVVLANDKQASLLPELQEHEMVLGLLKGSAVTCVRNLSQEEAKKRLWQSLDAESPVPDEPDHEREKVYAGARLT